ncbi:hypothetical protein C8Q79DRAFT_922517 [Trametes meyenii]|nr:hypothetical protein C8Q79DRAFT_922517 [Trametes meyenii]
MALELIPSGTYPAVATPPIATEQTALPAATDGDVYPNDGLLQTCTSTPPSDASSVRSHAALPTMDTGDLADALTLAVVTSDGAVSYIPSVTHLNTTHPPLAINKDSDDDDDGVFIPRGNATPPTASARRPQRSPAEEQKRRQQEDQKKDPKKDQKKDQKKGQNK